ncbi:MAG TPA: 2-hydroxymuconate tautomerase [Acidimicrobiia bacterium]|jgi:4-oxalocrotonate tautomerase|nr:2-hydroxymuconate tautomerase [Acidimicrobiia bacterium]
MPLVRIDMVEGRPPERLERMIAEVSEAIARSLEAPIESVRIVINELKPHQYGVGGRAWPVVAEDRRRRQEAQEDA